MSTTQSKDAGRDRHRLKGCARLLAEVSPVNREDVDYLYRLRCNRDVSAGSNENWLRAIVKAERSLNNGRRFRDWTPQELTQAIAALRDGVCDRTFELHAGLFRHFLKELHGDDVLPKEVNRATRIKKTNRRVVGNVVTPSMLAAMMAWCETARGPSLSLPFREETQCILQTDRHSGFRAGELLALHVGDVRFEDEGMWLCLRPGMPGLKTDARTIYVVAGVEYMRNWLAVHPAGHDRDAPLFCGFTSKDGLKRLQYQDLNDFVRKCAEESGANALLPSNDNITLHDFRHTCATEKAKLRWSEAQMRMFFGWSQTSNMAATYVHMNLDDLRDAVRRDAGLPHAASAQIMPVNPKPEDPVETVLRALAARLAKFPQGTG